MSLLRNVLRKNSASTDTPAGLSQRAQDGLLAAALRRSADAVSLRSAGGLSVHSVRSLAESVTSFASGLLGGRRVPKRRRPEVSRLGVPTWYNKDPPPPREAPGTETIELAGRPYTCAHAFPLKAVDAKEGEEPYCCLVLYSYADPSLSSAKYYDDTVVRGELRLFLPKPDSISSVSIWLIGRTESVFSVNEDPLVRYRVNLWDRRENQGPFGDKLPTNRTLVLPFEFPVFPQDIVLQKQDSSNVTRVPLPPTFKYSQVGHFSGEVKYYFGINVKRSAMMSFDDSWNIPFFYYQVRQPIPRELTAFPFISDREDWPYNREEIGGWTITPFGGRGRFRGEVVEIEGLLGVQAPEVYAPGQTVRWSVLLWSKHIPALEALADPAQPGLDAVLLRATLFGRDVLQPKNAARRNRNLQRLAQGRVWRADDGPPADDTLPPLRGPPRASGWASRGAAAEPAEVPVPTSPAPAQKRPRFQDVITAEEEGDDDDDGETVAAGEPEEKRSPSPASSEEELPDFPDMAPQEATVRLDGDVRIPERLGPSFRHMWMGREYVLQVTFTHPEYQHISPSAPGIYAETPIWLVTGRPQLADAPLGDAPLDDSYLQELPVVGNAIALGQDPLYADLTQGAYSSQERSSEQKRMVMT
ncbi:hypothetical protein PsYK624_049120 [Phanerochaete sordida]|uniref:Arrestin-like N-terminal domain-containing protein n=1 Tax=Phanerochaete sordida TaxID=48140 RepID=A0A9P3LB36_9APHY|nr:hypothetical protein PsYK624_049120 [Phanerochaete sordida]